MSDRLQNKRTRNWSFVIYPDSMPANYKNIFIDYHTNVVLSPLHDKDINPDGSIKKPHYHVLLTFESDKSFSQITELITPLKGTIPQPVQNVKGLVRYFIHYDNPEKAQYKKEDIVVFGYVDLEEYFKVSFTEKYRILRDIISFIDDNDIDEFSDFICYCMSERYNDWFPLCCDSNCNLIINFIKSKRYKLARNKAVQDALNKINK